MWSLPPFDSQVSMTNHVDAFSCTCESLCHILYSMTGIHYSPRALAIAAGVKDPSRRTVINVLNTANNFGLIRYEYCPIPDTFTFDSYYAFNIDNLPTEKLGISLISIDFEKSPYWTELEFGSTLPYDERTHHMVEQPDENTYYDSEPNDEIKPITYNGAKIVWQSSIKINHYPKNMYVETMNYQGTIGVFIPVSKPEQVPVLNNIFNVNLVVAPDGTILTDKKVKDA